MEPTTAIRPSSLRELGDIIALRRIEPLYQPIVDLDSGETVAFEALARGPRGSALEMPGALFGEAAQAGLVGALDVACRSAAVEGALAAGLGPPKALFINVEPSTLGGEDPLLDHEAELRSGQIRAVVEFTERALSARPAEVLAAVDWLRERGCGIALDDVGVDERSLALLPMLAPDVIKLDMGLVQQRRTSTATAHVVSAVGAHAERTGAALLAEGIETDEHLVRARAMGATLGQGWLFGRPAPLSARAVSGAAGFALRPREDAAYADSTPFELVADERHLRRGDKRLLLALSRQLEAEAYSLGREAVVLATFQDIAFFSAASREQYEALGRQVAFVGVLGVGIDEAPAKGVRGAGLQANNRLRDDGMWWSSARISPEPSWPRTLATAAPTPTAASTSISPTTAISSPKPRGR
jgi:EAL domain-containing protein (putative c-di-GMP-specific phosphodiesterase class I)